MFLLRLLRIRSCVVGVVVVVVVVVGGIVVVSVIRGGFSPNMIQAILKLKI